MDEIRTAAGAPLLRVLCEGAGATNAGSCEATPPDRERKSFPIPHSPVPVRLRREDRNGNWAGGPAFGFPLPFRKSGCPVLAFCARAGAMLPVAWVCHACRFAPHLRRAAAHSSKSGAAWTGGSTRAVALEQLSVLSLRRAGSGWRERGLGKDFLWGAGGVRAHAVGSIDTRPRKKREDGAPHFRDGVGKIKSLRAWATRLHRRYSWVSSWRIQRRYYCWNLPGDWSLRLVSFG